MSKIYNPYSVNFKALKIGRHHFKFEVDNVFFDQFPEGEIRKGKLNVSVELDKHSTMLEFRIAIEGEVEVTCDRCLELFMLPIAFKGDLFVKTTENQQQSNNDEIWFINSNEFEVDLTQYIYESICLSIPIQHFHGMMGTQQSDCDPYMLEQLKISNSLFKNASNKEIDPRWEKLKDFQRQ